MVKAYTDLSHNAKDLCIVMVSNFQLLSLESRIRVDQILQGLSYTACILPHHQKFSHSDYLF